MFDEFFGLPLHPLVVHLTVVLVPVTSITAVVFAVVRRWRWLLRWPLGVMTAGALASTGVSLLAGKELLEARPELAPLVADHEEAGERLLIFMAVFTVVSLVAVVTLGGPSPLRSGRGAAKGLSRPAELAVTVVVVVVAVACLYQVVITGDLGSRAVWGA
jgi:hypothetical protein